MEPVHDVGGRTVADRNDVVTMPELLLMRHAQAEPAAIDGEDFGRPLTAAGRTAAAQAARRIAALLAASGAKVECLLVSPARRTAETAAIVARELALAATTLQEVPELYLATPQAIRTAIERFRAGAQTILVIGHNPSLSEFGGELSRRYANGHLPTAGVWHVTLAIDRAAAP